VDFLLLSGIFPCDTGIRSFLSESERKEAQKKALSAFSSSAICVAAVSQASTGRHIAEVGKTSALNKPRADDDKFSPYSARAKPRLELDGSLPFPTVNFACKIKKPKRRAVRL